MRHEPNGPTSRRPQAGRVFNVSVVQNPALSLEGDVAATRQVIDAQDGQVVLVGHSYGGAVISEAGPSSPIPRPTLRFRPSCRPRDGFLLLDREKFADSFAGDLPAERAGSQVVEIAGSHAVYVSQPDEVAALIRQTPER
ncbi:hypothetical protein GCM10010324_10210 [Streptomyces hiroshimensis]|uniref:Alpha/beta hydrolase n=1 Tax=Streptomyces hiroshimensis TaxID=66424 RepID=A0ABQ2Y5I1_9ACTN|nr:hypothetical protein GCM10010324_10210 [Streptomyces hiroshimensis]